MPSLMTLLRNPPNIIAISLPLWTPAAGQQMMIRYIARVAHRISSFILAGKR